MRCWLLMGTYLLGVLLSIGRPALAEKAEYVGFRYCKGCHIYQYKAWKGFEHAEASEVLTEGEKKDPRCMQCHGTGAEAGDMLEGVQCEACHGPGSLYKSPKIMSRIRFKSQPEEQRQMAMEAGSLPQTEEVCLECHGHKRPEGHAPAKEFAYEKAFAKVDHGEE